MRNKTVIVILSVAALLVGFIFFFERDSMTTSERLEREERVFDSFMRDRVESISIEGTGGGKVVVKRTPDPEGGDLDHYTITHPKNLEVDNAEVRSIVSALDYLIALRTIEGKDERNQERYGLKTPRLKGSFTVGGKETSFIVGGNAEGDAVYLAVEGRDDAFYAVDEAFLESVDKGTDDLRSKILISGDVESAHGLKVKIPSSAYDLRRQDKTWRVDVDGTWIRADEGRVHELLHTIADLKASRFVKDDADESFLTKQGLAGSSTIELDLGGDEKIALRIGSPCTELKGGVHVTVMGSGVVVCADDGFLTVLGKPRTRLQDARPATFRDEDIESVTLTKGDDTLGLAKTDDGFIFGSELDFHVDPKAVFDLLGALRETRASEMRVGSEVVSNLGDPTAEITLEMIDKKTKQLFLFEDDSAGAIYLRRGDESALLTVPKALLAQARPDPLLFRERTIKNGDPFSVERITLTGPASQELKKESGIWQLTAPITVAADGMGARRIAELVAETKVERYVSKTAEMAHGFGTPYSVIQVKFASEEKDGDVVDQTGEHTVVLELGAPDDSGNRFARFRGDDETVFVVDKEYETAARAPLVARDLVQVDATNAKKIIIATGEGELVLEKNGEGFTAKGRRFDETALPRLLADLSGMKSIRTHSFEGVGPETEPLMTLEVWPADKETPPAEILVLGKSEDPKENGYFVCKKGLGATFVMPARIIDVLFEFVVE